MNPVQLNVFFLTILLQFTASFSQDVVHTCTFDNDNCGGILTSNIKVDDNVLSATETAYRITDVTSIITPTSNGQLCQIPYSFAAKEFFHCRSQGATFNCITLNGQQANCATGQFLYLKGTNTESYTSEKIPIPAPARQDDPIKLRFSFYYMFECSGPNCPNSGDTITVSINGKDIGVLNYGNAVVQKRWSRHSFDFTPSVPVSEIQYVVTLKKVLAPAGVKNMMAFDHVQLTTVGEEEETSPWISSTDEQEQTTTSATSTIETDQPTETFTFSTETTDTSSTTNEIDTSSTEDITQYTMTTPGQATEQETLSSSAPATESTIDDDEDETSSPTATSNPALTTNQPVETSTTSSNPVFVTISACNLDNDLLCGGNDLNLTYTNNQLSPVDPTYYITDVTSITKPTQNGQLCAIPFTIGNQQYFHCYSSDHKCVTNSLGAQDTCTLGKYLSLATVDGSELEGSYMSNMIFLSRQNGPAHLFRLSFYYLFDCEDDCDGLDDRITVSLSSGQVIGSVDNSAPKRQWIRQSFEFVTQAIQIQYIVTLKRSQSALGTKSLMAIDNFQLDILSDDSIVTNVPVDTTTTNFHNTTTVPKNTTASQSTFSTTKFTTTSPENNNEDSSNLVVIIVGVIIAVALVGLAIGVFVYMRRRKANKRVTSTP